MAEKKVGEEFVTQHQSNEQNDERVKIVLPNEPNATIESTEQNDQTIFDRFREGRNCWNWIFRILFLVISFYQVVYRMYIDFGCPNFDCHFKPNLTSDKTLHGVVATGNTVFTIVSFAALISYIFFIGSFFTASRLDSALVCPSETLKRDINKSDAWLLFLAYVLIIVSFVGLGASLYTLPKGSEIRDPHYTIAAITGTGAQLFVHVASINTCQVFAVSSLAIGMLLIVLVIHNISI